MEETRSFLSIESTKQSSCGNTETEAACMDPARVGTRSFVFMLWLLAWYFCQTPNSGRMFFRE